MKSTLLIAAALLLILIDFVLYIKNISSFTSEFCVCDWRIFNKPESLYFQPRVICGAFGRLLYSEVAVKQPHNFAALLVP